MCYSKRGLQTKETRIPIKAEAPDTGAGTPPNAMLT